MVVRRLSTPFLLIVLTRVVLCYPKGAPDAACNDMLPKHGPDAKASSDKGNLKLTAAPDGKRGAKVLLEGTFKGFMIKAMDKSGAVAGTFKPEKDDMAKTLTCDSNKDSAVTHKDNTEKTKVAFTWTAAQSYQGGEVTFKATVVRQKLEFFPNLESSPMNIDKPVGPTPPPSAAPGPDKPATTKPAAGSGRIGDLLQLLVAIGLGCVAFAARHQRWVYP